MMRTLLPARTCYPAVNASSYSRDRTFRLLLPAECALLSVYSSNKCSILRTPNFRVRLLRQR